MYLKTKVLYCISHAGLLVKKIKNKKLRTIIKENTQFARLYGRKTLLVLRQHCHLYSDK